MGAVDAGGDLPLQHGDRHLILFVVIHLFATILFIHIGLGIGKILLQNKCNAHAGIRLHILVLEHALGIFAQREFHTYIALEAHLKDIAAPCAGGKAGAIDDIAAAGENAQSGNAILYSPAITAIGRISGIDNIHLGTYGIRRVRTIRQSCHIPVGAKACM